MWLSRSPVAKWIRPDGRKFTRPLAYLEMGHQMCTISFYLLVGGNGTEHDFSKGTAVERSVGDPSVRGWLVAVENHAASLIY